MTQLLLILSYTLTGLKYPNFFKNSILEGNDQRHVCYTYVCVLEKPYFLQKPAFKIQGL